MNIKTITMITITLFILGCSAIKATHEANDMLVSWAAPPKTCQFLAETAGHQGSSFRGPYTPAVNLETGAMNQLKNHASKLGANYLQLQKNTPETRDDYTLVGVLFVGKAYKCPTKSIHSNTKTLK